MSVIDRVKSLSDAGGFAFGLVNGRASTSGMTLRDYFAGQVLGALVVRYGPDTYMVEEEAWEVADECYAFADAMLEARK